LTITRYPDAAKSLAVAAPRPALPAVMRAAGEEDIVNGRTEGGSGGIWREAGKIIATSKLWWLHPSPHSHTLLHFAALLSELTVSKGVYEWDVSWNLMELKWPA